MKIFPNASLKKNVHKILFRFVRRGVSRLHSHKVPRDFSPIHAMHFVPNDKGSRGSKTFLPFFF